MSQTHMSPRRGVRVAAVAAAAVLGVLTVPLGSSAFAQGAINADRLANGAPFSFADLIEEVSPAVVSVNVTTEIEPAMAGQYGLPEDFDFRGAPDGLEEFFRRFGVPYDEDAQPREARAQGSGFFISADGYLVTNNHVVANATKVSVALKGGEEFDAEIVGVDPPTDLAVLKVERAEPFPYVEFEDGAPLRVGDWVVAVGNPFGLGGTATAGIVSASGREIGGRYNDFLQIDAPINQGNSGGPTFDLSGRVVGVNSQIVTPSGGSVGIGFAIPADTAAPVVRALIEEGRVVRGWLGVTIETVDDDVAASIGLEDAHGAIVNDIVKGGPAEQAGFQVGDVVLAVNGERVETNIDLTRKVGALRVGERVRFHVYRDERERDINVRMGERPSDEELASLRDVPGQGGDSEASGSSFGLGLSSVDDATRARLGLEPGQGLIVESVSPSSEAAAKGLRAGDVVLEVSGEPVSTPAEFEAAVDEARESSRSAVLLYVQNEQTRRFVALSLTAEG